MKIEPNKTKISFDKLGKDGIKDIVEELNSGREKWSLDTFFTEADEVVKFESDISIMVGKKPETVKFRIDCAVAKDKNHPNHPENKKDTNQKAARLYYLQLQDNRRGSSGTYANVVYPQMDTDPVKAQGYSVSDLIDAIIRSLTEQEGYYLYV